MKVVIYGERDREREHHCLEWRIARRMETLVRHGSLSLLWGGGTRHEGIVFNRWQCVSVAFDEDLSVRGE